MPEYVVMRIAEILNEFKKPINSSNILLLGVAYKGDVGDTRESPALKVYQELRKRKANVYPFDPYVDEFKVGNEIHKTVKLTNELLEKIDIAVLTTAHKKGVDYEWILSKVPVFFDTKNLTKDIKKYRDKIILL